MFEREAARRTSISGIVVAHDWDDDGNVISVALATPLEDEYVVRDGASGEDLVELIGSKIVATGVVSSDSDWTKVIAVERYEVLEYAGEDGFEDMEEYEDEEYEDDYDYEDQEELEYHQER